MRTRSSLFMFRASCGSLIMGLLAAATAPTAMAAASTRSAFGQRGVVTFTGSVGQLPAPTGIALVEAELPLDVRHHVATILKDVVVARARMTGAAFRVTVPDSAVLRRAEALGHGVVNFDIVVDSGPNSTSLGVPVPLTAGGAQGSSAAVAILRSRVVAVPRLPRFRRVTNRQWLQVVAPADPTVCTWSAYQGPWEKETPIGEVHVSTASGVSDDFEFSYQDYTTLNFGGSASSNANYVGVGNLTVTDSWTGTGGHTFGSGSETYVGSHFYWQRYFQNGAASCPWYYYKEQAGWSVQDVFPAGGSAGYDPYGGCTDDPYGYGTLVHNSHWNSDRAQSQSVSIGTSVFGMGITGSSGFTSDINQNVIADGSAQTTHFCGPGYLNNVSIIYDTLG